VLLEHKPIVAGWVDEPWAKLRTKSPADRWNAIEAAAPKIFAELSKSPCTCNRRKRKPRRIYPLTREAALLWILASAHGVTCSTMRLYLSKARAHYEPIDTLTRRIDDDVRSKPQR
jgi:hypothetical protein